MLIDPNQPPQTGWTPIRHVVTAQVALAPSGGGQTSQDVLNIHCGTGQQILRWLGYAACTMLSHKRGKGTTSVLCQQLSYLLLLSPSGHRRNCWQANCISNFRQSCRQWWLVCAGEVMGCYVPQAVIKDGTVLDADLVLSEVVADGELLLVEYSTGPVAYTTRYGQGINPTTLNPIAG